ncbi:BSD domain-containing protein [Neolecta irregularis DAH-3]|uniref:BSD domain-containing protein n=1 Tax=Neolecta irregularis (strain DAH-3) TaxID=1198029 RepID=A0A1U7LVS8_NEOID|nr:BSD domain-containing protein [Neolecta irregularis DAH-3]|eukprot:OLL26652.1 BSD domain-containing protein [Neolecta irregularis DAH-3]
MDVVFDHVQEQSLSSQDIQDEPDKTPELKSEVQSALHSFASSSWGQTLTSAYHHIEERAKMEITELKSEISESISRSRSGSTVDSNSGNEAAPSSRIASLVQSAQRVSLKDLEKVEQSAETYLRGFRASLGAFIKDAVTITSPQEETANLLFEANIAEPTDSQLHVLNISKETYTVDPSHEDYPKWKADFTIDQYDEKIEELKRIPEIVKMRAALPIDLVSHNTFWMRYLFNRKIYEKDRVPPVLSPEEDINWDSDDENEQSKKSTCPSHENIISSTATLKPESRNSRLSSDGSYDVVNPVEPVKSAEGSDDDWE